LESVHQPRQPRWGAWSNAQIVNNTLGLTGLSQNNQLNRLTQQVHTLQVNPHIHIFTASQIDNFNTQIHGTSS
jgi:hypothetical protein